MLDCEAQVVVNGVPGPAGGRLLACPRGLVGSLRGVEGSFRGVDSSLREVRGVTGALNESCGADRLIGRGGVAQGGSCLSVTGLSA